MCTGNEFGFGLGFSSRRWCLCVIFLSLFLVSNNVSSKTVGAEQTKVTNNVKNPDFMGLELLKSETETKSERSAEFSGEMTDEKMAESDEEDDYEYTKYSAYLEALKPKISVKAVMKGGRNENPTGAPITVSLGFSSLDITNFTRVLITCNALYRITWEASPELVRLCAGKMLRGMPCDSGACLYLPTVHFSGAILCASGQKVSQDYYFTGLDRQTYWERGFTGEIPRRALINMNEIAPVLYTNQEHLFFCEAPSFLFTQHIKFLLLLRNNSLSPITLDASRIADPKQIQGSSRGTISTGVWLNLTTETKGVVCFVPWYNTTDWLNMTRAFTVKDVAPPAINKPENPHPVFYLGEKTRNLFCSAKGDPPPTLNWTFNMNNTKISIGAGEKTAGFEVRATEDGRSTLAFPKISKDFAGVYICSATNEYGNDTLKYSVDVDEPGISAATLSAISILGLLLILSFFIVLWKYILTKSKLRNLTQSEIEEFEKGNLEKLKQLPEDAALEQFQYLPFNRKFELKESDLSIFQDDILGQGEFGKVLAGKLRDVPVAVKTTKVDTDVNVFKEFLKEIKVMTHIGEHENVVKLLGAVTSKIRERLVYIVVELSPFGSLESHLENNRNAFVAFPHQIQNQSQTQENGHVKTVITISDMIKWCMEIAQGMSHLASKKIIHGDLAVRNILLFDNHTAKITDFGLSVHLYDKSYAKKQLAMMPWRSMAIESLRDLKFSTQSDIWAFGVTVWEVFTFAQVPYPGLNLSPQFLDQLENGMRMHKPPLASNQIYNVMLKCWNVTPEQRPSFEEIALIFRTLVTTDSNPSQCFHLRSGRTENIQEISSALSANGEEDFEHVELQNLTCGDYTDFNNLC